MKDFYSRKESDLQSFEKSHKDSNKSLTSMSDIGLKK